MLERARQCEQVTNQRTRQQQLELDRSEPQSGFAQRRHDLRQVWARAYQQRDRSRRIVGLDALHQLDNARCFVVRRSVDQRVELYRGRLRHIGRLFRYRRLECDGTARHVAFGRQHANKRGIGPIDQPLSRTEIARELQALQ